MTKTARFHNLFDRFFRDKQGKLIIGQSPNAPIWGWGIFTILAIVVGSGKFHDGFQLLAQAFLFVWAYLELRQGDSLFRKVLGTVIFIGIVVSFFK